MAPHPSPTPALRWRSVTTAGLLIAAATSASALLDREISLASQAMLHLLAVVIAAYVCDRLTAAASAIAAVTALNFFFVPPRYTLAVERREHLITLATMLGVALLVSWLSARVRSESRLAAESERRARQLSALAVELLDASDESQAVAAGERALRSAFERVAMVTLDAQGELQGADGLAPPVLQSLRCAIDEAADDWPGHRSPRPGIDPGLGASAAARAATSSARSASSPRPLPPLTSPRARACRAALASVADAQGLLAPALRPGLAAGAGRPAAPAAPGHLSRRRATEAAPRRRAAAR